MNAREITAYQKGVVDRAAFEIGQYSENENPYKPGSETYLAYEKGWNDYIEN